MDIKEVYRASSSGIFWFVEGQIIFVSLYNMWPALRKGDMSQKSEIEFYIWLESTQHKL